MTTQPEPRRLAIVRIDEMLIAQMLTEGYTITRPVRCIKGLPPGARLIAVSLHERFSSSAALMFEHESFAPVTDWDAAEIITPTYSDAEPIAVELPALR